MGTEIRKNIWLILNDKEDEPRAIILWEVLCPKCRELTRFRVFRHKKNYYGGICGKCLGILKLDAEYGKTIEQALNRNGKRIESLDDVKQALAKESGRGNLI